MLALIVTLLMAGQSFDDPRPYTPNDTVLFALADLQTLDASTQKQCRYLSLAFMPAKQRGQYTQILDLVLNGTSRRQSMVYVQPVAGSNGCVVRLMLSEYKHGTEGWFTLARRGSGPVRVSTKQDQPEPYYNINLREIAPAVVGKEVAPGTWFDITAYETVRTLTGSEFPMMRADWFIGNVSLNPAYSEFLEIKTLTDFNKLVRFRTEDQDLSGRAVVADSQLVSLHQRGIEYTPKVGGTYWQTYDYFKSTGINNLLKDPLNRKRDAGEILAELPNGLQAFALVDGADKIIDVADGNIVMDKVSPWKHGLVWNGMYSCTVCHKNGAQDILDEVRPLTAPPRGLISKKQKEFQEFVDLYSKNMEAEIANTRQRYAAAVLAATRGMKVEEAIPAYGNAFVSYWQKPLDLAQAAREVGCTPDQLKAIIGRILEPDPAVTTLLAGRPLRRDLWEAAFPLVATAVYKEIKR